jgi:predicted permease
MDRFYEGALERARRLPGVAEAAIAVGTPFGSSFQVTTQVPGREELPELPGGGPYIQAVTPGYFATVGLDLLQGRGLGPADRPGSERVAVVNRSMAEAVWPGEDPLGECLLVRARGDETPPCTRVVGVVEDAHRRALREKPAMQYYIPFGQEEGFAGSSLLVRAAEAGDPRALLEPLRKSLLDADPGVLWIDVALLDERLVPQLRPWRLGATLMGVFGALALVIAAVGLYSLLAHMVASRTAELGIRSALGAQRRQILGLVVRQGLGVAGLGLALGVLLSLLGGRQLGDLLFETAPHDPVVYGAVVAILAAAAILACLVPGRRATKVDPAKVLRAE